MMRMKLKEVISLKTQKSVYLIEEAEGEFTYRYTKISKLRPRISSNKYLLHLSFLIYFVFFSKKVES